MTRIKGVRPLQFMKYGICYDYCSITWDEDKTMKIHRGKFRRCLSIPLRANHIYPIPLIRKYLYTESMSRFTTKEISFRNMWRNGIGSMTTVSLRYQPVKQIGDKE